jgi:hypothetical protein
MLTGIDNVGWRSLIFHVQLPSTKSSVLPGDKTEADVKGCSLTCGSRSSFLKPSNPTRKRSNGSLPSRTIPRTRPHLISG